MQRLYMYFTFLIGFGLSNCSPVFAAKSFELGGIKLEFSAPKKVRAYDYASVSCKLSGTGEAIVQITATDVPAYEKYFDTAIPHKIAFRFDMVSEDQNSATFKVTNVGDTIWKAAGYGQVYLASRLFREAYIMSDLAPEEFVTRTFPMRRLTSRNDRQRRFSMHIERNRLRGPTQQSRFELSLKDFAPGQSTTSETVLEPNALLDSFDEFGHAFARYELKGKPIEAELKVQVPPWADRLVIRLIKNGEMKSASMPLKVSQDSLKFKGKPNTRWTLNGKPILIIVNVPTDEIPTLREKYGGADNIVLTTDWTFNPDSSWLKAIRDYGFKIFPYSLFYVRLQMAANMTGRPLMQNAYKNEGMQRVDALDPDFAKAAADVVDRLYESAKDVLYRTADGKVPICLSGEQSYGYPWAKPYPSRWGGGSPQDVSAFRIWLNDKYGEIEKLNETWKTQYKGFEEIDPSPICGVDIVDYPDPWKEWGPAIEDFDLFRSKIHGEFWAKAVAEIKSRHPDVLCGMNFYGGNASDAEPIYQAFYNWGVKDYRGKGVNWLARRSAVLPDDMMCFDFIECWNSSSPDAVQKNIEFWSKRGKEVVTLAREYSKVVLGGDVELRTHAALHLGLKGHMIGSNATAFYPVFKKSCELGGISGALNDPAIASRINESQRREIELFCKEGSRLRGKGKDD